MSKDQLSLAVLRNLLIFVCGVLAATALVPAAFAQQADAPSKEAIVDALKPRKFRGPRGVNIEPGQAGATPPSINLTVNFAYKSTDLTTDAQLVLKNLGQALADPALSASRFRVAGHTDAVGGDAYNQTLSEQRARAVVEHLVRVYRIASDRLVAEGFGRSRLYNPADPNAEINRRVEIINAGP